VKQATLPTELPPKSPSRQRDLALLALLGIVVLTAALRIYRISDAAFELDELWTAELSTGRGSVHLHLPSNTLMDRPPPISRLQGAPGWWTVWTSMEDVTHPPLYFMTLRWWRMVFGESETAARALSVFASVLATLLLYDIGSRLSGRRTALWACLIMAFAQYQIRYGQNTRNYAFLMAVALSAGSVLVRIEQEGITRRRLILLGLAVLATLLTHYFAAGTVAALFLYAAIRLRGKARWATLGAFAAAGVVFLIAWGPFFLEQRSRFTLEDSTTVFLKRDVEDAYLGPTYMHYAMLPWRYLVEECPDLIKIVGRGTLLSGLLFIYPWIVLRRRRDLLFWNLWFAGTVGCVAFLDFTRGSLHSVYLRYLLLGAPAIYIMYAGVVRHWLWSNLLPILALVICMQRTELSLAYNMEARKWPQIAQAVDEQLGPGDVLVIHVPHTPGSLEWAGGYFCMGYTHYSKSPDRPIVILTEPPTQPLLDQLRSRGRIFLLNTRPEIPVHKNFVGFAPELRRQMSEAYNYQLWLLKPQ
jgi:uncharacterized membrane protein